MFMAHPPLYLCVLRHDKLPVYRCCSQHLVPFDARGRPKVPRFVFFEEFDRPPSEISRLERRSRFQKGCRQKSVTHLRGHELSTTLPQFCNSLMVTRLLWEGNRCKAQEQASASHGNTSERNARMPSTTKEAVATVRRTCCEKRCRSLSPTVIAMPPFVAIARVPPSQGARSNCDFKLSAATATWLGSPHSVRKRAAKHTATPFHQTPFGLSGGLLGSGSLNQRNSAEMKKAAALIISIQKCKWTSKRTSRTATNILPANAKVIPENTTAAL